MGTFEEIINQMHGAESLTPTFPRPLYTDYIVVVICLTAFVCLTIALERRYFRNDGVTSRACWGVVAIGMLWQAGVSFCRIIAYRLPDAIWSGWALDELGICALSIVILYTGLRDRKRQRK